MGCVQLMLRHVALTRLGAVLLQGGEFRFASTAKPTPPDSTLRVLGEIAQRCSNPQPVTTTIKSLSPFSLAAIFKYGKGFDGYLKDHASSFFDLTRRPDGVMELRVTLDGQASLAGYSSLSAENIDVAVALDADDVLQQHNVAKIVAQIKSIFEPENAYKSIDEVYAVMYPSKEAQATTRYADLLQFVSKQSQDFWVVKSMMCIRRPGELVAPPLPPSAACFYRVTTAHSGNNYGGWGALNNVPNATDVYEILKYIPVHWGNLGNIHIPPEVKKKHVRISSVLQWLRRQPSYFEVRNMAGTLEVRRSVLLHPEAHGFTKESAQRWLEARIFSGEHNCITTAAGSSTAVANSATTLSANSAAASALLKFVQRVVPPYFVTANLVFQRYTKKNLKEADIVTMCGEYPDQFEVVPLCGAKHHVIRRKTGTSLHSQQAFHDCITELTSGGHVQADALAAIINHCCVLWDRPSYLYVRMSDEEKTLVGGYDGMMQLMQSKPRLFTVGEHFFKRNDLSSPISTPEPQLDEHSLTLAMAEENPYLTPRDVALVFHYVCPEDQPVAVSHFVDCSSPAMRCVLPPRVMSLIELFPDLFSWREVTPGVYSVKKVLKRRVGSASSAEADGGLKGQEILPPHEALEAIACLIPDDGSSVEVSQLQLWASMSVNQSIDKHYHGLRNMLSAHPKKFELMPHQASGGWLVRKKTEGQQS